MTQSKSTQLVEALGEPETIVVLLIGGTKADFQRMTKIAAEASPDRLDLEWAARIPRARSRLAGERIDAILLDSSLLNDPRSVATAEVPTLAPTPVVALVDSVEAGLKMLREGAQDYLLRSRVGPDSISQSIRNAIERARLRSRLEEQTRRLEMSESRVRHIVANNADGTVVIDHDGGVLFANPAVESMFGRSAQDLLGQPFGFPVVADTSTELDILRPDGEAIVAEMRAVAIVWEGQTAYLASLRDITDRILAEEKLREYASALEESNRALQDFAFVAAHDLQEPLRKVEMFAGLLASSVADGAGEDGRDYSERMLGAVVRMQTLIDDLLKYSRVSTRTEPFESTDLGAVVADVVSDLESLIEETQGGVNVGKLPVIDADPSQIRQLLQNLIANGLKFHRPGVRPVVTVEGRLLDGRRAGDHPEICRLSVQDNGIGFDMKHVVRIFSVFERLHGRNAFPGTGIGLAIARKIVDRHHGEITATSTPGEGSTFIVTLPVRQAGKEQT